jgi:hypothetical protein
MRYKKSTLIARRNKVPRSDIDLSGPVDCKVSVQKKLFSDQKIMLS